MKNLLLQAMACGLVAASVQVAAAQGNPAGANAPRFGIAVVDISWIFENYPRFKSSITSMQTEMKALDDQLKAEAEQLRQLEQQRNQFAPGSNEFKQADENLARLKADFQIKTGKIRRDFLEREAKLYLDTYTEVSKVIDSFARNNNIGLVLRFNGEPPAQNPQSREDVGRTINQAILFQNNIDITPDIAALLSRSPAPQQAARPGVAPR